MSIDVTRESEEILRRHLQAFIEGDLEAILVDYSEDAVLYTPQGPLVGIVEIRGFFEIVFNNLPHDKIVEKFLMNRQDVVGEIAYIVWSAFPIIDLATDTFIIRAGKIASHTTAMNVLR